MHTSLKENRSPYIQETINSGHFHSFLFTSELKYPKDSRLIIPYQKPKQICKTLPNSPSWCLFTLHNGAYVASGLDFSTDDLKTKIWLQTLQTEINKA